MSSDFLNFANITFEGEPELLCGCVEYKYLDIYENLVLEGWAINREDMVSVDKLLILIKETVGSTSRCGPDTPNSTSIQVSAYRKKKYWSKLMKRRSMLKASIHATYLTELPIDIERPDIAKYFQNQELLLSGFKAVIPRHKLEASKSIADLLIYAFCLKSMTAYLLPEPDPIRFFTKTYNRLKHGYLANNRLKHGYLAKRDIRYAKNCLLSNGFTDKEKIDVENLLLSTDLTDKEKYLIKKVSPAVHPADTMYEQNALNYLCLGLSAVRVIRQAIDSTGEEGAVGSILDFACGYGRVLRYLRVLFPNSDITAAEIDNAALDFCRQSFSVNTILSNTDFGNLSLPKRFDLIWCGSLFTHINEKATIALLQFFHDHLSERGLCVFTSHGQSTIDWIQGKFITLNLDETTQEKICREFQTKGYGFVDFPHHDGYGMSAVTNKRMIELARGVGNWNNTLFIEHGWGNYQDVYAFAF